MWRLPAGMLGVVALAPLAGAQGLVPERTTVLFAPGSAEVTVEAREVVLAFLRQPRPPGLAGHCLRGHADSGPAAEALALARVRAVAAVLARQGVDPADVEVEAAGDSLPVRLAPPGKPEPMNDRVEMIPCPGPRGRTRDRRGRLMPAGEGSDTSPAGMAGGAGGATARGTKS
jgi:outer membrane protein OmpA-like peptidoglycan-associated protein